MQTSDFKKKLRVLSEIKKAKTKKQRKEKLKVLLEKSLINRSFPPLPSEPRNGKYGCRKITLITVSKLPIIKYLLTVLHNYILH